MEDSSNVSIVRASKTLSWLLRHGAVEERFHVRPDGFVDMRSILSHPKFLSLSERVLRQIVRFDAKKRFSIWEDGHVVWIRANQGHSGSVAAAISPDALYTRLCLSQISPTSMCIHGTNHNAWENIRKEGISKMSRHMIHMANRPPEGNNAVSGIRSSCNILIFVDMFNAIRDGVPFFKSENDVILSPGADDTGALSPTYFKEVLRRHNGKWTSINWVSGSE